MLETETSSNQDETQHSKIEKGKSEGKSLSSSTSNGTGSSKGNNSSRSDVKMEDVGEASGAESPSGAAPAPAHKESSVSRDSLEQEEKKTGEPKRDKSESNSKTDSSTTNGSKSDKSSSKSDKKQQSSSSPPPPVLRGTLSYNLEIRRHVIRGMWNYENSNAFPAQRFELLRNLAADEDPTILPKDGEFHGSFSLAYFHTTSKGVQKERRKVIPEKEVKIKFTKLKDKEDSYQVDGRGENQFGIFHINGTATPSPHDNDPTYNIVLRKRYEPSTATPNNVASTSSSSSKKRKVPSNDNNEHKDGGEIAPLPPPSKSFPSNVVCLRGNLFNAKDEELVSTDVVHRIHGMWSSGLDLILADPQNVRGLCNRFEYEHKSAVPSSTFPVSGRYSGWFDLNTEDGKKTRINERDVVLRFIKNKAGYHNVEGRGSNVFGKYTITGTLSLENVITIFRHFQPRKVKPPKTVTSLPPPINSSSQARRPSTQTGQEPQLKLEEVEVPNEDDPDKQVEAFKPPAHSSYSAVSRGVLRLNEDGSHSCQGKWAVTREHFTNGQTSNFSFRLEAHFADQSKLNGSDEQSTAPQRKFPLDSARYKGSFQLKKGTSRSQTVVDQQIVMKFRKNSQGAYNVYGKGVNAIGIFNLMGTLIMSGKTGGQVELYRMYPPALLSKTTPKTPGPGVAVTPNIPGKSLSTFTQGHSSANDSVIPMDTSMPKASSIMSSSSLQPPGRAGIQRRESSRVVKLPSRLEDDDPKAQLARIMEKCTSILRQMREKDVERNGFFSEPVDPIALGIPTYLEVIKEPMDLKTVHRKMESNEIDSPEEFARLVRLVFQNAITFNVDPAHSVHQAARSLLILFNQKYRDVERMVENLRRAQKGADMEEKGKKKKKDDKKRKRTVEEPKSLKRRRLEEAQAMAAANNTAMASIVAAAPSGTSNGEVSRTEFNLMLQMMQLLQKQIVQTHTLLAELSPGDETDNVNATAIVSSQDIMPPPVPIVSASESTPAPAPAPERKKTSKKKEPEPVKVEEKPPAPVQDEDKPLTLQEQEILTDTINKLASEHLGGVITIIRESAKLSGDEDEIDLEIDQLDNATQRKLLKHVSKFIKQPKRSKSKSAKKSKPSSSSSHQKQSKSSEKGSSSHKSSSKEEKEKVAEPTQNSTAKDSKSTPAAAAASNTPPSKSDKPDSFFAFDSKGDSDTDSDEEEDSKNANNNSAGGKQLRRSSSKDHFNLGDGFEDDDDDDDDEDGAGGFAANWNISKPVSQAPKDNGGDEDDAWGAAREAAVTAKAKEAEKKAREEKLKAEAEQAKNQRLADAAARGEELRAQRMEEEANAERLREQKEREAEEDRKRAKELAKKQVQSVEQTVDLDAQRDIMRQYEQSFLDKELGSASPSSDFGF